MALLARRFVGWQYDVRYGNVMTECCLHSTQSSLIKLQYATSGSPRSLYELPRVTYETLFVKPTRSKLAVRLHVDDAFPPYDCSFITVSQSKNQLNIKSYTSCNMMTFKMWTLSISVGCFCKFTHISEAIS